MAPCPPQRLGEGNTVIAQHDPINGQLFDIGDRPQMLNFAFCLCLGCAFCHTNKGTDLKAKRLQIFQQPPPAVRIAAKGSHTLNDVEGIEVDAAILTDGRVKQPNRTSGQIPGIFDLLILGVLHLMKRQMDVEKNAEKAGKSYVRLSNSNRIVSKK